VTWGEVHPAESVFLRVISCNPLTRFQFEGTQKEVIRKMKAAANVKSFSPIGILLRERIPILQPLVEGEERRRI
jgi:hypothetical protein